MRALPHPAKIAWLLFIPIALVLGLSSCGDGKQGTPSGGGSGETTDGGLGQRLREEGVGTEDQDDDDPRPLIGIAYDEAGLPFRAVQGHLSQSVLETFEEEMRFDPVDALGNPKLQVEQIREFTKRKAKVLIVYPFQADDPALAESMKEAKEAGIKILCIGSGNSSSLPADAHILVDERAIGKMAGDFVIDRLKRKMEMEKATELKGNVVEITGLDLEGDVSRERSEGFHEVLSAYPGVRVVHQAPGLWNERDAASRLLEALRLQPEIDVVYCHNDAMAHAAYLASREQGRHQGILFVGTDGIGGPVGGISHVRDQLFGGTIVVPLLTEEISTRVLGLLRDGAVEAKSAFESELVTIANSDEKYRIHTQAPEKVLQKYKVEEE